MLAVVVVNGRVLQEKHQPGHCTSALAGRPRRTASPARQALITNPQSSSKAKMQCCTCLRVPCLTAIATTSHQPAVAASNGRRNICRTLPPAPQGFQDEAARGKDDPQYIQHCYWAARRAVRKYRAARGRFGQRKGRQLKSFKRNFRIGGLRPGQRRIMRGFAVGGAFVQTKPLRRRWTHFSIQLIYFASASSAASQATWPRSAARRGICVGDVGDQDMCRGIAQHRPLRGSLP